MDRDTHTGQSSRRRWAAFPVGTCLFLAFVAAEFPPVACGQRTVPAGAKADATNNLVRRPSASKATGRMEYVIDANDVLDVYVVDVPQFSRNYRVAPDGTITVPLLTAPIMAEGLTLNQLSAAISQKLHAAGLVSHAHILVSVKSSQAHAVTISGAVRKPQVYPLLAPTTLLDVLSQGGGLAPDAGSIAVVTRGDQAARSGLVKDSGSAPVDRSIKVNLKKLLATGDPGLDVAVYPGDKVTVQRAGIVYVVGAVQRPGGFPLSSGRDRITVLQAVALGEGLKPTALQKKAVIIRRGGPLPNGSEEIPVNLKKILSGHASDLGLEANDILFIPDSASKRALRRGAEAAIQIASGVVIWGRY